MGSKDIGNIIEKLQNEGTSGLLALCGKNGKENYFASWGEVHFIMELFILTGLSAEEVKVLITNIFIGMIFKMGPEETKDFLGSFMEDLDKIMKEKL